MPAVVSDSSPLVYLSRLDRLNLLAQLYQEVFIPAAVWEEVAVAAASNPEGIATKQAVTDGWLKVESPTSVSHVPDASFQNLGAGEREAILLAKAKNAMLIIDELDGKRVATKLGILCTGTLGVLVEAKFRGLVPSVKVELDNLRAKTNFRFTQELFETVLRSAGEAD